VILPDEGETRNVEPLTDRDNTHLVYSLIRPQDSII